MLFLHPADPTLTTDSIMEVVKGVEYRWWDLGHELVVQTSKKEDIGRLYPRNHQRMEATLEYYTKHHPVPSWKEFAEALHRVELYKQANEVKTKYIEGMAVYHVMCDLDSSS